MPFSQTIRMLTADENIVVVALVVVVVALVFLVGLPAWAGRYARSRS